MSELKRCPVCKKELVFYTEHCKPDCRYLMLRCIGCDYVFEQYSHFYISSYCDYADEYDTAVVELTRLWNLKNEDVQTSDKVNE